MNCKNEKRAGVFLLLLYMFLMTACSHTDNEKIQPLPDGIYRGYYSDNGMIQIGLEFTIAQGVFADTDLFQLHYKDGDYLADDATGTQKEIAGQFMQLIEALPGHGEERIRDLYMPGDIAMDADAVSGATLKSGKLVYAIHDGLLRGDVSDVESGDDSLRGFYTLSDPKVHFVDGTYRGFYYQDGIEQIAIQFNLTDGVFSSISFRRLAWEDDDFSGDPASESQEDVAAAFNKAAEKLIGHAPSDMEKIYADAATSENELNCDTDRTELLSAAIINGLNHGPFRLASDKVLPEADVYRDGVYSAILREDGKILFHVRFVLKKGCFETFEIKDASDTWTNLLKQYFKELQGQDVTAINALPVQPGQEKERYSFRAAIWRALGK